MIDSSEDYESMITRQGDTMVKTAKNIYFLCNTCIRKLERVYGKKYIMEALDKVVYCSKCSNTTQIKITVKIPYDIVDTEEEIKKHEYFTIVSISTYNWLLECSKIRISKCNTCHQHVTNQTEHINSCKKLLVR